MSNRSESDRRKKYFQDHWEGFDFSTDEMSTHPELHYELHQQEHSKELKKKTSRGNRKLQRFRAKLKKQRLDNETITTMINNLNNPSRSTDERNFIALNPDVNIHDQIPQETIQVKVDKRKRDSRPTSIVISPSGIIITQPLTKRQRSTTSDDIKELRSDNKPKYSNVRDHVFKNILTISLEGIENIVQPLKTPGKLQYTRLYAQLVNNI